MSALLVDDLIVPLPTRPQATAWRHVEPGSRQRPHLAVAPETVVREPGVPAPVVPGHARTLAAQPAPLRLTDRGIAVVLIFFLAVVATAAVILVTSFLSVSNDPIPASGTTLALVATQA